MDKFEHVTYTQLHGYYAEVIRDLTRDGLVPSLVISPLRGGIDFGVKLSEYYDVPVIAIRWQTRHAALNTQDVQMLANALAQLPNGSMVLIADDICDSGETFKQIANAIKLWPQHATRIRLVFVAAINNVDVKVCEYGGRDISRVEEPAWFIFPWEEWWKPRD